MSDIFHVSKLIRFQHCDPAGIVFYPQYFVLFHEVIEDWFYNGLQLKFADLIVEKRFGAPTVDIRAQFLAPSRLGETLEFSLLVRKIGGHSIDLNLAASAGEKVRARIEQTLVLFSFDTGQSIPVPDDLRESMLRFCSEKAWAGTLDQIHETPEKMAPGNVIEGWDTFAFETSAGYTIALQFE